MEVDLNWFLKVMLCSVYIATGCISTKTSKDWNAIKSNPQFEVEKAKLKERLGGKLPCLESELFQFTNANKKPLPNCLYPVGKFESDWGDVVQSTKRLKIFQVVSNGFLVDPVKFYGSQFFIYEKDRNNLIDGAYFDSEFSFDFYEYVGPFSFQTLAGQRTLYSFKKVSAADIQKMQSDFKVYNLYTEILAQVGAWNDLSKTLHPQ